MGILHLAYLNQARRVKVSDSQRPGTYKEERSLTCNLVYPL